VRTLVTGGGGFIGRHLVAHLLALGHRVCVLDDFSTGDRDALLALAERGSLTVVEADVREPIQLEADACVHLACPASPVHYQADPVRTLEVAVWGTRQVLTWASSTGARVVHASTSEVYGDPEVHPQPEHYPGRVDPLSVRGCYDEGKRAAEALCQDVRRTRDVDVRVLRIFNTYGPGMHHNDGRVVPAFIADALAGRPLRVHGSGLQSRSFCYVDDLVQALVGALRAQEPPPGPVNVGRAEETTVLELAHRINRLVGNAAGVEHTPRPEADPSRRCPDLARVRAWLGWSAEVGLDEGLLRTLEAMRPSLTR